MGDQGTVGVRGVQETAPKYGGRVATSQNGEISTGGGFTERPPVCFYQIEPGIINRPPWINSGDRSRKMVTGFLLCGNETQPLRFCFPVSIRKINPEKQEGKEETGCRSSRIKSCSVQSRTIHEKAPPSDTPVLFQDSPMGKRRGSQEF